MADQFQSGNFPGGYQGGRGFSQGGYPGAPPNTNQQQVGYAQHQPQPQYQVQPPYGYTGGDYGYPQQRVPQHQQQPYYAPEQGNYDNDDYDNLNEIDRELNISGGAGSASYDESDYAESPKSAHGRGGGSSSAYLPRGALPSQNGVLSEVAAEFWFPEARNCTCCKGFKHGCSCCKNGVTVCADPGCIDAAFTSKVSSDLASRAESSAAVSEITTKVGGLSVQTNQAPAPGGTGTTSTNVAGTSPYPPRAMADVCRFQSAPGGCRFGASCRFVHTTGGVGATGPAPSPRSPANTASVMCTFFLKGNCHYGASCRFSHG